MATHAKHERFQLGEKKFENFDAHPPKSTSETTLFEHQKVLESPRGCYMFAGSARQVQVHLSNFFAYRPTAATVHHT